MSPPPGASAQSKDREADSRGRFKRASWRKIPLGLGFKGTRSRCGWGISKTVRKRPEWSSPSGLKAAVKAHVSGKVSGLVGQDEETEDVSGGEDMRIQPEAWPPG